jgi:hypothetical protein
MEREFCSYEQALALKELGFDEKCLSRYCAVTEWEELTGEILLQDIDCNVSERFLVKAPLKQQVLRWFREKYGYDVDYIRMPKDEVFPITKDSEIKWTVIIYRVYTNDFIDVGTYFNTYEQAENACIDKLLEIAKQQDND